MRESEAEVGPDARARPRRSRHPTCGLEAGKVVVQVLHEIINLCVGDVASAVLVRDDVPNDLEVP
eukprot:CAMPEP_0185470296 /NCGR_PEP_ID=MMETSP1365-20130426/98660_1 /TAXON_ID=38817 /ORGANISM="Gephyrocapsa oceanica, Strain RCC1303" /LENGTH=64 /DNA_ID=CAMNT_0028077035 /DNA_START=591 /DNA_END=781 /DNA_ORIENTATION=-